MGKYDSLIHRERPRDPDRVPMSLHNRAAQFAPFDALTGFGGRIYEASRLTVPRPQLEEEAKEEINRCLLILQEEIKDRPRVCVTYFVPDETKEGGGLVTEVHRVKRLDVSEERLEFTDGLRIDFDDIQSIQKL